MRKEYKMLLTKEFDKKLFETAPEFELIKTQDKNFPGQRVYRWSVCNSIKCFVVLLPDPKGSNRFTIEVGWSKFGQFPDVTELGVRPSVILPNGDHTEFNLPQYICRLGMISDKKDKWWNIGGEWSDLMQTGEQDKTKLIQNMLASLTPLSGKEAESEVKDKVQAAIALLVSCGIPYLKEYAKNESN